MGTFPKCMVCCAQSHILRLLEILRNVLSQAGEALARAHDDKHVIHTSYRASSRRFRTAEMPPFLKTVLETANKRLGPSHAQLYVDNRTFQQDAVGPTRL